MGKWLSDNLIAQSFHTNFVADFFSIDVKLRRQTVQVEISHRLWGNVGKLLRADFFLLIIELISLSLTAVLLSSKSAFWTGWVTVGREIRSNHRWRQKTNGTEWPFYRIEISTVAFCHRAVQCTCPIEKQTDNLDRQDRSWIIWKKLGARVFVHL